MRVVKQSDLTRKRSGGQRLVAAVVATVGTVGVAGPAAQAELIYGVTQSSQTLVTFDSANPNSLLSGLAISGLATNERITGIDFRPRTGELFAVGNFSNLYTINTTTGAASRVGTGFAGNAATLNGSQFGFDFNPTIDRIRNVADTNQNLVLNPLTGTSAAFTNLFFATGDVNFGADPNVVHSAYNNNFDGATTSQLFGIDSARDILVRQANNTGVLNTVGSIGTDITSVGGFDISGLTGIAYLAVEGTGSNAGFTMFWSIDLATGLGTAINGSAGNNRVGGGETLSALTVAIPEPASITALVAAAGMTLLRRRSAL